MNILIKNGRVLDPAQNRDEVCDVLVENGRIKKVGPGLSGEGCQVIDASGKWVTPGFIDVHVHLREPGFEKKETIATGSRSAAMGGFTTICAMPNTEPVTDNEIIVSYIKMKAEKEAVVHVLPIGAITKGQKGEEMANIGLMAKAGACAISEDGKSVADAGLLKTAMKYASMFKLPILSHCEDKTLSGGGLMHAGVMSNLLGLKGISRDSEDVMVARDIILANSTGARLHICHVSTEGSVDLIRQAKKSNPLITAEVCPHHFTLTDQAVEDYDTNAKMAPPLREQSDINSLLQGLKDGTIDIIATDHAPHHLDDKNCEFEAAAFGIVGLETAIPLCITGLVQKDILTPLQLIAKLTVNPAKMLGIDKGTLKEGAAADIAVIDDQMPVTVDVSQFKSKGKNSPFGGFNLSGKTYALLVDGNIVVENYELKEEAANGN